MATYDFYGQSDFHLGSPYATLIPPASNLSLSNSTSSSISGSGYVQLSPGIKTMVDFDFSGYFAYKSVRTKRGSRKRQRVLSDGLISDVSMWTRDAVTGIDISGLSLRLSDLKNASTSVIALRAFERNLLAGADEVSGSVDSDSGTWAYTYEGNDTVDLYTGYNYIELGDGNDQISAYGDADVTVYGGPGSDIFSPSISGGFMWVKDFQQGIDMLSLGFTPRTIYGADSEGNMGLSLYLFDGTPFARITGATSL
jgi:hypothetical protein